MWWYYVLGYTFSIFMGLLMISLIMRTLRLGLGWKANQQNDKPHPYPKLPEMVGVLERSLYTASWQLGKPEFIGVWLVLKVAGQWKGWSDDKENHDRTVSGRVIFNIFLIGNGLSIGYAVVGALLIEWLRKGEYTIAIVIPTFLVFGSLLFWYWAKRMLRL